MSPSCSIVHHPVLYLAHSSLDSPTLVLHHLPAQDCPPWHHCTIAGLAAQGGHLPGPAVGVILCSWAYILQTTTAGHQIVSFLVRISYNSDDKKSFFIIIMFMFNLRHLYRILANFHQAQQEACLLLDTFLGIAEKISFHKSCLLFDFVQKSKCYLCLLFPFGKP